MGGFRKGRGIGGVAGAIAIGLLGWTVVASRIRPGPRPGDAAPAGSTRLFEDVTRRAGVVFDYEPGETGDLFIAETMGGGVGLIDFDGDGWLDIYFINGCRLPVEPGRASGLNKLYRNNRDGTFADVTERAGVPGRGYGMGCAVGDYDNDGDDDLFVTGFSETILYQNQGDGTFRDVTRRAGVGSGRWTTAAGFGDLDGDGDLDLFVVTYVEADSRRRFACYDARGEPVHCPPQRFHSQFDLLYRNNGDGTFSDVSRESGIEALKSAGLGLAIADFDDDGRLDVFVANDTDPNELYRNLGGLRFQDVAVQSGVAYDGGGKATASMGVVADDLDGDGRIDLFHTNFTNEGSTFLKNLGGGSFEDVTAASGLRVPSVPMTGFGTVAFDLGNDGLLDLFVANGHVDHLPAQNLPMAQLPQLYVARGGAGRFRVAPTSIGPYFARPVVGRGVAAGDLDNDGRVDLVVVQRDAGAILLRQAGPAGGHWLGLALRGRASGRTPIGAKVTCRRGGETSVRWLTSGTSFLAAGDQRIWFGLGKSPVVDRLEVRWPSGRTQSWGRLDADQILEIVEGEEPRRSVGMRAVEVH